MYIYICVGAVYAVDIEPVASCSIGDGKEQMEEGGGEKKKKEEETYRSVVEHRNRVHGCSIVDQLTRNHDDLTSRLCLFAGLFVTRVDKPVR